MLKTISAALLAVSVIAAPALAAEAGKDAAKTTTQAPVIKADQAQTKTHAKADIKSNSKAMNANAAITKDEHVKATRSHRHHQKVAKKHLTTQPAATAKPASTDKRS
ncbi:hypothetical protein [Bradyrhizobium sp.]|uniref:His-rich protein BRANT n=1 Tax=Bradyrhizobium sp. TaxID=376 RepID=UPI0023842EAF|nr:hypothetical protein [Bradyrhizobium sp.]MDE2378302.1 hypothetical protein [Bradyrhizobium sp.]